MKTNRIIMTWMLALLSLAAFAQEDELQQREIDPKVEAKIRASRIAFITERLNLTPDQAEKFWPVYNEFVQKQQGLKREFRDAQRGADPNDPKKQEDLVKLGLKLRQNEVDLERDYSDRIMKTITAQQLLNLRKAEQDFRSLIINTLQQRRVMQERKENFRDQNQRLRKNRN